MLAALAEGLHQIHPGCERFRGHRAAIGVIKGGGEIVTDLPFELPGRHARGAESSVERIQGIVLPVDVRTARCQSSWWDRRHQLADEIRLRRD